MGQTSSLDDQPVEGEVTLTGAARRLGVTAESLRKRLQRGKTLRGRRVGEQWYVHESDVLAELAASAPHDLAASGMPASRGPGGRSLERIPVVSRVRACPSGDRLAADDPRAVAQSEVDDHGERTDLTMRPADGSNRLDPDARRVLALAATGLVTDELAARLEMAPEEVRRRLVRAILALGGRSKLEAVVIALSEGLIDLPPGP